MHPDTARSLNNLALIYQYQEKDAQAEPLYQRALAINEQMLGAMHPTTRIVHKNYVTLLQTMGRDVK